MRPSHHLLGRPKSPQRQAPRQAPRQARLLSEAELEVMDYQLVTFDQLMEGSPIPRPCWPLVLHVVGPYPYPYDPITQNLCNVSARTRKPNMPKGCPKCGAYLVITIGKKPGKAALWVIWCHNYDRNGGTCEFFCVPDQLPPLPIDLFKIFQSRQTHMWRVAGEALESHNPSGTPLPTTDQEARFWMRVNGFVSEGDGSFHFPGVTPHKNRSWPSDDKTIGTPTPSPKKGKGRQTSALTTSTPTPSPQKGKGRQTSALNELLREVFVNHGSPQPPSSSQATAGSSSSLPSPTPSPGPRYPLTQRDPSPGTVLVPGTPESGDDKSVISLSSDDEDTLPPAKRLRMSTGGCRPPIRSPAAAKSSTAPVNGTSNALVLRGSNWKPRVRTPCQNFVAMRMPDRHELPSEPQDTAAEEEFEVFDFDFSAIDNASLDFDVLEARQLSRAIEESRREAILAFSNTLAMTGGSSSASAGPLTVTVARPSTITVAGPSTSASIGPSATTSASASATTSASASATTSAGASTTTSASASATTSASASATASIGASTTTSAGASTITAAGASTITAAGASTTVAARAPTTVAARAPATTAAGGAPTAGDNTTTAVGADEEDEEDDSDDSDYDPEAPDYLEMPDPIWLRVVVWRRRRPSTTFQPLWQREFFGHELEIGGLLFDQSLLVYRRRTSTWVPFDRNMIFYHRGRGYSVLLRLRTVTELWNFNSELARV